MFLQQESFSQASKISFTISTLNLHQLLSKLLLRLYSKIPAIEYVRKTGDLARKSSFLVFETLSRCRCMYQTHCEFRIDKTNLNHLNIILSVSWLLFFVNIPFLYF